MNQTIVDKMMLAMEAHELQAYYQPQYDATTGIIVGAEALVRWIKKDGTVNYPDSFIPQLEKSEAINLLDWFMVEETLKTISELGKRAIPIAINFSRWHVREADFVDRLDSMLKAYKVKPDQIEIELTESAIAEEQGKILEWSKKISDAGFKMAIDDFGSGLSSMSFLRDTPATVLKVDKTLIDDNCQTTRGERTLEAVFYLAHLLHMETVAEGVETNEQLKFLQSCVCNRIQGFLFSKPLNKEHFMALCTEKGASKLNKRDILKGQDYYNSINILLKAIYQKFPYIIFGNLTMNSYYVMSEKTFLSSDIPQAGIFDDLTKNGFEVRRGKDLKLFQEKFSRKSLLDAYKRGEKKVSIITTMKLGDGEYKKVETTDYFVKNPASPDILIVGLNSIIDE